MENNIPAEKQEKEENLQDILSGEDYKRIIENLLFITDRPLTLAKLSQLAQVNDIALTGELVRMLQQEFAQTNRAIAIVEIGGGFQMSTKPEYGRWVRQLFNEKSSIKLSNAALETLAIIAYKQPITRAEIESIRGVDIVGPLEKIMERGLVKIVGKKDVPGKPLVYGTTEEFLRLFGLNSLSQLPELKSFATKEIKEVQNDLPFQTPLPKTNDILPLEEGDNLGNEISSKQEEPTLNFEQKEEEKESLQQKAQSEDLKTDLEEEPAQVKTEEVIDNAMGQNEIK